MVSQLALREVKNQVHWRSTYILWIQIPFNFIFKITSSFEKKRNCRDSCIDSIFKSLVAGIIKVPIRLYWSLTFKDTSIKKRLLCSLLCRYLWCLYQKISFQCKKKRAVAVRIAFRVRMCWNILLLGWHWSLLWNDFYECHFLGGSQNWELHVMRPWSQRAEIK